MLIRLWMIWIAVLLMAGCASYSGSGLVPGTSRAADVQALMGEPAEKLAAENGDTVWFYPRLPTGRQTFAVRLSPDGVVLGVDQRLTEQNVRKLVAGKTTMKQVRLLLGPPFQTTRFERQQRLVWEYPMYNDLQSAYNLSVQFSYDGIVREVLLQDYRKRGGP
jgi:SmpA / OmlA family